MARFSIWKQAFDTSNMGKSAIVSHSESKKHMEKINDKSSISTLFF